MIEENKYCSDVIKNHFNRELVMTKEENWKIEKFFIEKFRGSAHRDCNINLKLNHKIYVVFHNLKQFHFHLIIQELGKFNLKINVIPNRLEKYMSFTINNQLRFIGSFQFLRSSLDSLGNSNKDDFKYLSQELDNNALDLVNQKRILSLEIYE